MKMDKKLNKMLVSDGLVKKNDRVLVGVSGGADSVCLLHLLAVSAAELGITVFAAHINHSLRPEADSEEAYVHSLCTALGIECFVLKKDAAALAKEWGVCVEQAGRKIRYDFFNRLCAEKNINKIATAHHMNDNAETILMHFIRGAGLKGLSGIAGTNGRIIRPLLGISREETERYCCDHALKYCTDKSNFDTDYTRNRLRLVTIPDIEKNYNPSFVHTVTSASKSLADDLDYIESETDKAYADVVSGERLSIAALRKYHVSIARRAVMRFISEMCAVQNDIYTAYTDAVYSLALGASTGKKISLPGGYEAQIEYDTLVIEKPDDTGDYEYTVRLGTTAEIPEAGIRIRAEKAACAEAGCFEISDCATITVRNRRNGDVFFPVGMSGSKKLKNYFIDEKMTRRQRSRQPLLAIDGEIAWIIGHRRDRRFLPKNNYVKITVENLQPF